MGYNLAIAIAKNNPRALARANNDKMYMPDKACPKGHISLRYTKYGQCLDCLKISKENYRNTEAGKKKEAEYRLNFQKQNRGKLNAAVYGLTEEEVLKVLKLQNNSCNICNKPFTKTINKLNTYHIDHCHKTNKFRGLLCHSCNVGLGHFKDNIELMKKAINYLQGM